MDSTTSGSVQSSSGGGGGGGSRGGGGGGDEEYTSQPDFLSSFLTLPPPPPPPSSSTSHLLHHHHHHHHHHPSPSFVDSFSTFLDPLPHSLPRNPSPPASTNPFPHSPSPLPNPSCTTAAASSGQHPVQPAAPGPARASKKRSRASRRPPTTVLSTDTSNFRAMVQEFTGFPAPPFSSSFARPRLDLFHQSPYLLRPFAQKNHASTFSPINSSGSSGGGTPSTMVDAIASIARNSLANLNTLLASTGATSASVPIDLQHPNLPSFALQSQPTIPKEFAVGDLGSFVGSESLIKPAHRTSNSTLSIWADGLGLDGGDRDPLIGSESAAAKRSADVDKGRR